MYNEFSKYKVTVKIHKIHGLILHIKSAKYATTWRRLLNSKQYYMEENII